MVGFSISWRRRAISMRPRRRSTASSTLCAGVPSAMFLTSPPAQNARPAPVRIMTPALGSIAKRGRASRRPSIIGAASAFIRSGRLSVRVTTPSASVSMSCCSMKSYQQWSKHNQALKEARINPRLFRRLRPCLALDNGAEIFPALAIEACHLKLVDREVVGWACVDAYTVEQHPNFEILEICRLLHDVASALGHNRHSGFRQ